MLRDLTDSASARATLVILAGVALVVAINVLQRQNPSNDEIALQFIETAVLLLTTVAAAYLLLLSHSPQSIQVRLLRTLLRTHRVSATWRAKIIDTMAALGTAIDRQFRRWDLSPLEREVALLLLKGFDCPDIALLQDCSERAVRKQVDLICWKANLSDRVALSSYFFDDLQLAGDP